MRQGQCIIDGGLWTPTEILVVIAYVTSEGSSKPGHPWTSMQSLQSLHCLNTHKVVM